MSAYSTNYIHELFNAITEDDGELARQLLSDNEHVQFAMTLSQALNEEGYILGDKKSVCHITNSGYRPDDAWCLATIYNARNVMQVMIECSFPISLVNGHGNTFLHCIIAQASVEDEDEEEKRVSNVKFIKSLISHKEYASILLMENNDGLRPLELASHLGTFSLFQFIFDTKCVYISKLRELSFSSTEYFDITEYEIGKRYFISPPYTMMLLDQRKMNRKSVQNTFLSEPMKTWFAAISYSNMFYIIILAFLRITNTVSFFVSWMLSKVHVIHFKSHEKLISNNVSTNSSENRIQSISQAPLIVILSYNATYSIIMLLLGTIYGIYNLFMKCQRMKWRLRTVSGMKDTVAFTWLYLIAQTFTLTGIFVLSVDIFYLQTSHQHDKIFSSDGFNFMAVIVIVSCVWDILYYLQLIPGLSLYVIAVQRMLNDFTAFSIVFMLFFFSYIFGFYILDDNAEDFTVSAYNTFQLMLNIVNYSGDTATLKILHVAFIFLTVYLLLNILIAIFASSYEYVYTYRHILCTIQRLSVFLVIEPFAAKFMRRLHAHLRKKHLVFEDGRVYIIRTVRKPFHK